MLCNMHLSRLNRNRKRGCINLIVNYEMNLELRYDISLQEILSFYFLTFKVILYYRYNTAVLELFENEIIITVLRLICTS